MTTRREAIQAIGAAGLVGAGLTAAGCRSATAGRRLSRIGLALYTVRDRMPDDLEATLAHVAGVGYTEVEFHDYFGRSPEQIRQALADAGLQAPSAHRSYNAFASAWQETIDYAAAAGHQYLVLAWLAPDQRATLDDYRRTAEFCNRLGEQAKAAGLTFAYHNHDFEFEPIDGQLPWDLLAAETDPALVQFELDLYWIATTGEDASARFRAHPGRFPMVHLKDMTADGAMADVGAGTLDFAPLLAQSDAAGIKHYYVERDDPSDSFESIAQSYRYLHDLTY